MEILKSEHDTRLYRLITLDNGLKAVLIHSPLKSSDNRASKLNGNSCRTPTKNHTVDQSDMDSSSEEEGSDMDDESLTSGTESEEEEEGEDKMATLALAIGVGSFLDPEEAPGLAHLAEHMVFMGSEKYPKENAFDEFVHKHGGYTNAETDNEHTLFILEIRNKYFHKAMDMIASIFIAPLMLQDSLSREIQSVDSEFLLKVPDDDVRRNLLLSSLARPGHPMGKFVWGTQASLQSCPNIYERLHQFCKKYYVAQFMVLAIQSQDDLDTQEELVRNIFSMIPKSDLPRPVFGSHGHPFQMETFSRLYHLQSVKKSHKLVLTWSLPSLQQHYKAKPIDVIAHLMSFEGRGSLLAHFRQKAWAYELEAGNDQTGFERNTIQTIYEISVGLSEEGLEHVCEIITTILAYIKLLTTKDIEPFFHELQSVEYNSFLWYKEDPSTDWVEQLSYNLLNYEPQYCITGNDLYFDYDEKLIKMCLQQLTPDSLNIIIQSSSFPTEELPLQEPYSHASYSCQEIPQKWMESWKALDLADFPFLYPPPPNPFLPKDFTIIIPSGEVAKHPVKILEDDFGVVWHKKDMKFLKPKVYICLRLITPILKESAKNSYLLDLLILGMEQELKLDCYHAYITGYNLNLMSASDMGLEFFIDGYHDKISMVLKTVLDHFKALKVDESIFDSLKIKLKKDYQNSLLHNGELSRRLMKATLDHDRWTLFESLDLDATLEELKSFIARLLTTLRIQCLFQGNLTSDIALDIRNMIKSELECQPLPVESIPPTRAWRVEPGEKVIQVASLNPQDSNNVVSYFCQQGKDSLRHRSFMDFLMETMEERLYDQLRTKEQLGYTVSCQTWWLHGCLGFLVKVYSPSNKFSCMHIYNRIKAFLKVFVNKLYKQSSEEFQEDVDNYVAHLRAEDIQLDQETENNWSEIYSGALAFDRRDSIIRIFEEELKHQEFLDWLHQFLDSPAIFSTQVVGNQDMDSVPFDTSTPLEERLAKYEICTMYSKGAPPDMFVPNIDKFKEGMSLLTSKIVQ